MLMHSKVKHHCIINVNHLSPPESRLIGNIMTKRKLFSVVVNHNGLDRLNANFKVVKTHTLLCGKFCVTCVDEAKDKNVTDMSK